MYTATITTAALAAFSLLSGCAAQTRQCPYGEYIPVNPEQRPRTRNCGTLGYLASPSPIEGSPLLDIATLDDCVRECKRTAGCLSFGYSAGKTTCALYTKRLIDMKYRQPKIDQGTVFYNQLCYKCKPMCPSTEAVTNGGFEDAADGDANQAVGWTLDQGQGQLQRFTRGGNAEPASILIMGPFGGSKMNVSQVLNCVNPGLPYTVSAEVTYRSQGGGFSILLDGETVYEGPKDCTGAPAPISCNSGYSKISGTVIPKSPSPTLTIVYDPINSASSLLDDVSMTLDPPVV